MLLHVDPWWHLWKLQLVLKHISWVCAQDHADSSYVVTYIYPIGKPSPLMMSSALEKLGGKRSNTVIIGDRMDTDIIGGLEAGIETLLVLSGVTSANDLKKVIMWSSCALYRSNFMIFTGFQFSYKPGHVLSGINELMQVVFANAPSAKELIRGVDWLGSSESVVSPSVL